MITDFVARNPICPIIINGTLITQVYAGDTLIYYYGPLTKNIPVSEVGILERYIVFEGGIDRTRDIALQYTYGCEARFIDRRYYDDGRVKLEFYVDSVTSSNAFIKIRFYGNDIL